MQENGHFQGIRFEMAIFPVSRGKNRISQGVENQGSLISGCACLRIGQLLVCMGRHLKRVTAQIDMSTKKGLQFLFPI